MREGWGEEECCFTQVNGVGRVFHGVRGQDRVAIFYKNNGPIVRGRGYRVIFGVYLQNHFGTPLICSISCHETFKKKIEFR